MFSDFELKRIEDEAMQELVNDDDAAVGELWDRVLKSFEQWKQEKGDRKPRANHGMLSDLAGGKPIPFKKATPWQCADFTTPSPVALVIKLLREDYSPFWEIMQQEGVRKVLAMLIVRFGKDSSESDVREAHGLLIKHKLFEIGIRSGRHSALQPQNTNLAEGRPKGVLARQKKAKKRQTNLINAIESLFDTSEKPGWVWTNPEIVDFLKRTNNNYDYADSSILTVVKREVAKYRKARKEEQASKYPNR